MWWKYFCRRNCSKYDNVRYITCKSLYKNTKEKSTKEESTKEYTKDKIQKIKIQKTEDTKDKIHKR